MQFGVYNISQIRALICGVVKAIITCMLGLVLEEHHSTTIQGAGKYSSCDHEFFIQLEKWVKLASGLKSK